jgi:hypothetical protein
MMVQKWLVVVDVHNVLCKLPCTHDDDDTQQDALQDVEHDT